MRQQGSKIPTLKFLVISRPYIEIEREFKQRMAILPAIRISGEKEPASIGREINLVIQSKVKELGEKLDLSYAVRNSLQDRLLEIPYKTYLWLHLVFDSIENTIDITEDSIGDVLDKIPESVNKAYTALLEKSSDKVKARKLLNIVFASRRPLTLTEINITMAIQDKHSTKNDIEESMWQKSSCLLIIKNICRLFVTVVDTNVYLIDKTARDFLLLTRIKPPTERNSEPGQWKETFNIRVSHDILGRACISYLLLEDFARAPFVGTKFNHRYVKGYDLLC